MKRALAYILCFPILFVIGNIINCYIHDHKLATVMLNKYPFHELEGLEQKPKLVLIGSSTTRSGYSLQMLRDQFRLQRNEVISLALGPDNAEINYYILKEHIEKFSGATVVYSIDPWIFSEFYYQHFNYKLSQWSPAKRIQYLSKRERPMGKIFDVLNGGNVRENITRSFIQSKKLNRDIINDAENEGYESVSGCVSDFFNYPRFGISPDFMVSLSRIDSLCYQNNCPLLVRIPAYSESFIGEYKQIGYHETFTALVSGKLKHAMLNLALKSLPDSQFADMVHINTTGKHVQTNELIRELDIMRFSANKQQMQKLGLNTE